MKNQNIFVDIIRSGYIGFIIFLFIILLAFLLFSLSCFNLPVIQSFNVNSCFATDNKNIAQLITINQTVQAEYYSKESIYAKIIKENVYFYSQPINNEFYKLFCVPRSYFVLLTDNAEDTQKLFYKAKYLDLSGFIKKNDVLPIIGSPEEPFAQATFKTFSPHGLELRSSANTSFDNVLTTVPFLNENLTFYGKTSGEIMVPAFGGIWYYCKFTDENTESFYGYLYSGLCCDLTTISENQEVLPEYIGEVFPKEVETSPADNEIKLNSELKIIIIICACLPCLLIIYLLFKPTKLLIDNGKNQKKKIKRLKKSEYYEYDD